MKFISFFSRMRGLIKQAIKDYMPDHSGYRIKGWRMCVIRISKYVLRDIQVTKWSGS
jgi:hypothetical protein